jgi:hypothetical protein
MHVEEGVKIGLIDEQANIMTFLTLHFFTKTMKPSFLTVAGPYG